MDYARAGNRAQMDITLDEGPLEHFTHSMEPQLRQLGLPTALKKGWIRRCYHFCYAVFQISCFIYLFIFLSILKGVVTLLKDYEVCKEGDVLTPEQARVLVRSWILVSLALPKVPTLTKGFAFVLTETLQYRDGGVQGADQMHVELGNVSV